MDRPTSTLPIPTKRNRVEALGFPLLWLGGVSGKENLRLSTRRENRKVGAELHPATSLHQIFLLKGRLSALPAKA
jgi:hypothetical protein